VEMDKRNADRATVMSHAQSLCLDESDLDLCAKAYRKESMLIRVRARLIPIAATAAGIAVVASACRASAGYPYSDFEWQPAPPTGEQVLAPGPLGWLFGTISYAISTFITYCMVENYGLAIMYSAYRR